MARWWLFWASLAAVLARSDDCSEQHDSVCPASQYRMTPGRTVVPTSGGTTSGGTTPVPTQPTEERRANEPTMEPTATPGPTQTPTRTEDGGDDEGTEAATAEGRRLRPRAQNGTVASNAETDDGVDIHADWLERFRAYYDRQNRPIQKHRVCIEELSKYMSPSDLDQIRNQPLNELLELALGYIRDETPVEFADLVVRIRDESQDGVAVKAPSFSLRGLVLELARLYQSIPTQSGQKVGKRGKACALGGRRCDLRVPERCRTPGRRSRCCSVRYGRVSREGP